MKLGFELKLEQTQKLIMTPELKQAISLLQCSAVELSDLINEEMVANPLLEAVEKRDDDVPSLEEKMDWESYIKEDGLPPYERTRNYSEKKEFTFENFVSKIPSLQDVLTEQLRFLPLSRQDMMVGEYLIGNIDGNGYLQGDLEEAALQLGCKQEQVGRILEVIQSFEPSGIGARNLQECLLIQIRNYSKVPPLVKEFVCHHLKDVADNRLRRLAQHLEAPLAQVQEAVDFIRRLNPKPGHVYGGDADTRYVVPDILVKKIDNDYMVVINEGSVPHLHINSFYRNMVATGSRETSDFVKRRLDSALWLIRSIEQRRRTLYSVACRIFEFQRPFLDYGVSQLRPLTLREIAEEVGVHESTVSRATSNKYAQTPRGVFPLKYFFSGGLESDTGMQSTASIKARLKELVNREESLSPLSDSQLTKMLQQEGIDISRRTVAKYREELGIPASHRRKRLVST